MIMNKKIVLTATLSCLILLAKIAVSQCNLTTSPNRNISCGDTVHLHAWAPDWQQSATFGSGGTSLVFHAAADTVLAATTTQLFRSTDAGQTFSPAAVWPNGRYRKMFKLDNKIIAVGDNNSNTGRIISSTDNGYSWNLVQEITSTNFYDVHFPSQTVGYAAGVYGANNKIAKTINGGNSWTALSFNPSSINLNSVYFLNDTIGFCGGSFANGKIFKTTDGGVNWSETTHSSDGNLLSNIRAIQFIFGTHGFALADDKLYRTLDSGATWQTMPALNGSGFKAMYIHDSFLGYIAGINTLLKTTDGGTTWTEVAPDLSTSYNALHFVNPQKVYVAATSNHVYREVVNAYSWSPASYLSNASVPNPVASPLASVTYTVTMQNNLGCSTTADIEIDVAGLSVKAYNSQQILPGESVNLFADAETQALNISYVWAPQSGLQGYTTASPVASPTQNTTYYVTVSIDNSQCFAVDSVEITLFQPVVNAGNDLNVQFGGNVSFYEVSFDEFMTKKAPYDHAVFSRCKFFPGQTGFLSNNNGKVLLKSYDMGNGWIPILNYDTTVYEMSFFSETHGALGDVEGKVYITNDGGSTWLTSEPFNDQITAVFYTTQNTLYIGSDNGYMEKTDDNGQNWTSINTGTSDHITSLFFTDAQNGWAAFSNINGSYIKRTTNGGQTWTPVNGTFASIEDIYFHNANEGIVLGYTEVKRTVDGGQTWSHIVVDNGMLTETGMHQIEFLNANIGYIGLPFIKTTDGGATWTRVQTQNPPQYSISAIHEDTIFGVGHSSFVRYVAPQFNWIPAAYLDNPHAKKPVFTPGVTTTYTVEVNTLYNGAATDQITITVPDPCVAAINYTVNPTTNAVTFSTPLSQPPYTSSPFTFLWQFSDGSQSTLATVTHVFSGQGYHSATLTASSYNGCTTDSTVVVAIGNNVPAIDCQAGFLFDVDDQNKTVTFTNVSLGNNLSHYFWYFDDMQYDMLENPVHTYTQSGIYNVCLTVFSQSTECYNTFCKQITVDTNGIHCMAKFAYTIDTTTNTVNYINQSLHNPTTYAWNFGDGQTSSLVNPTHTFTTDNYYFTHLRITENTCIADYAALLNLGMQGGSLQVYFGYIFNQLFSKPTGFPVDFFAATVGVPAKYKWEFGDGETDSLTNAPTHIYAATGNYQVCLTVSDPVNNDTVQICRTLNIINTGQDSPEAASGVTLFPNPTNTYFTVNVPSGMAKISIVDITGKVLFQDKYTDNPFMKTYNLSDISESQGVLFVFITDNKGLVSVKKVTLIKG